MLNKLLAMIKSPGFPAVALIGYGVHMLTQWTAESERRLDALNGAVLERLHALEETNVAADAAQARLDAVCADIAREVDAAPADAAEPQAAGAVL